MHLDLHNTYTKLQHSLHAYTSVYVNHYAHCVRILTLKLSRNHADARHHGIDCIDIWIGSFKFSCMSIYFIFWFIWSRLQLCLTTCKFILQNYDDFLSHLVLRSELIDSVCGCWWAIPLICTSRQNRVSSP